MSPRSLLRQLRLSLVLFFVVWADGHAATVTLTPAKDTTIYSDGSTPLANAKGVSFFAGRSGQARTLRALVKFDLAGQIPAGATVTGVTLTLAVTSPRSHPLTLGLHRLSADWGEGTSDASRGEGGGVAATAGDATWLLRFHDTGSSAWTAAGGDFPATASATQTVPATTGSIAITSTALASDVQVWLANPATNFGWLLRATDESAAAARFASREGTAPPSLQITYETPVAPTINAQPQNTLVTAGQPATFSVTATGTAPLTYQWRRNGLALASATNATYTIPTASRTDADYYDVVVTNGAGSVASQLARLSVAPAAYAGSVTVGTVPRTVLEDDGMIVNRTVPMPDGGALVAGEFISVDGSRRVNVARLTAQGSVDLTFAAPDLDGSVEGMVVQPDGRVLIVGNFFSVGAMQRLALARLNVDGSFDNSFWDTADLNASTYTVALQPDGKILVGGGFYTYRSSTNGGIRRLLSNGAIDSTFRPGGYSGVYAIAQQADGKIVIGGQFGATTGQPRNHLARLNVDGTLDLTFDPGVGPNLPVRVVRMLPDGKLLIAGLFTSYNGVAANRIVRLEASGAIDTTFATGTGFDAPVYDLALQADGRVVVGGSFTRYDDAARSNLARLSATGSLDATFNPSPGGTVRSTSLMSDDRIMAGGAFRTVGSVRRFGVVRLNTAGVVDANFAPSIRSGGSVNAAILLSGGKILAGGSFTHANGVALAGRNLIRFNADTTIDATFNPGGGPDGAVYALLAQPDGRIVIGGAFSTYDGMSKANLARVSADGAIEIGFPAGANFPNSMVSALAAVPGGGVAVGGSFTAVGGSSRMSVARLHADGLLDAGFVPVFGSNSGTRAVGVTLDGKVYVAGSFALSTGVSHTALARLRIDGSFDSEFAATSSSGVAFALALQPDGKVIAQQTAGRSSGSAVRFNTDGTQETVFSGLFNYVKSFVLQEDGKVVIVGGSSGPFERGNFARAEADGTSDATFSAANIGGMVNTILLRDNGQFFVGGSYAVGAAFTNAASGTPPAFLVLPVRQTAIAGSTVKFTASATGDPAPAFQWHLNGAPIAGATTATYTINSATLAHTGSYTVLAANTAGNLVSPSAALIVMVAPSISSPPAALAATAGAAASFNVSATGSPAPVYQWRKGGTPIAGATAATLTLTNVQPSDAGNYSVSVSNAAGSVVSAAAAFTVNITGLAPVIATQPVNQLVSAGQAVTFSIIASGGALTYQWRKGGANLAGATDASLTLASVQPANVGVYSVMITNGAGSVTSHDAILSVIPAGFVATHALLGNGYVPAGTAKITTTINYTGALETLSYQVLLPAGLSYSTGGGAEGHTKPAEGTVDLLEWLWSTPPASPATFTYTLKVAAGTTGPQTLAGLVTTQPGPILFLTKPDPLLINQITHHSADTMGANSGTPPDGRLNLAELLRVIELYNHRAGTVRTGQYTLQDGTEDGFTAGPGGLTLSRFHSADTMSLTAGTPPDGKLNLAELLRVIELYNYRSGTVRTGQYRVLRTGESPTEDGFTAGP